MTDLITRMEYRAKLPKELAEWYDSEEPGNLAEKISTDLHIDATKKVALINIIGDTVLHIINRSSLKEEIKKQLLIDENVAQNISERLLLVLTNLGIKDLSSQPSPTITSSSAQIVIPSYQKPLMGVPRYQNTPPPTPTASQHSTIPPITPKQTPSSQPPAPPQI